MAPLGALSQAWVSAEASKPVGWRIAGVMIESVYNRVGWGSLEPSPPASRAWVAVALDPNGNVESGEGDMPEIALSRLADRLRERRGPASG
jgi:hypothetical protein